MKVGMDFMQRPGKVISIWLRWATISIVFVAATVCLDHQLELFSCRYESSPFSPAWSYVNILVISQCSLGLFHTKRMLIKESDLIWSELTTKLVTESYHFPVMPERLWVYGGDAQTRAVFGW